MKHLAVPVSLPRLAVALLAIVCGVILSLSHQTTSQAAGVYSHNPAGFADYCQLSGSTTILHGWAYDPDAAAGPLPNVTVKVGAATQTVASSVAGYRDADVNAYIKKNYPGAPTGGTYGWTVSLTGLYKGTSNVVSGTVINYGTGANATLSVNHTTQLSASQPDFTTTNAVPEPCLATKPAPAPAPTPTPTPTPVPTPSPVTTQPSTGTSTKTTPRTPAAAAPAPVAPAPASSNADGVVTAGTTAATVKVPADGAASLHIVYSLAGLASNTDEQTISGDTTTVTLTGLQAASDYTYQIVRTNSSGTNAASAAAPFSTKGYTAKISFQTSGKQAVSGITGLLSDAKGSKATSDKNGVMTFPGLPGGGYTVTYRYKGKVFTRDINTTTSTAPETNGDGSPATITLADAVNVDALVKPAAAVRSSKSGLAAAISVLLLVVIGGAVWFVLRRRKQRVAEAYDTSSSSPGAADIMDQQSVMAFTKHHPVPEPLPSHAGESLREMVLESMHAQAAQLQPPQPALVPQPLQPAAHTTAMQVPLPTASAVLPPAQTPMVQQQTVHKPVPPAHPSDEQTIQIPH